MGPDPLPCQTVLPSAESLLVPDLGRQSETEGGGAGVREGQRTGSSTSYKHLSESVSPGAGDVALRRVKRHIVDRFLELLPVSRELLDAGFTLQVPQADGAVVTCSEEERIYFLCLFFSTKYVPGNCLHGSKQKIYILILYAHSIG